LIQTSHGIVARYWALTVALLLTFGTGAQAAFIPLTATLTGSQETPPNLSTGIGNVALILDDVGKTLIIAGTFSNLTSPTAATSLNGFTAPAFIQSGLSGQAGPAVHPLLTFPTGVTAGSFTDVWTALTNQQILSLESGGDYINIYTSAFPGGEIRGQIVGTVPEPSSLMLMATGAAALLGGARLRRRRLA
jgi:hypothetical protein